MTILQVLVGTNYSIRHRYKSLQTWDNVLKYPNIVIKYHILVTLKWSILAAAR